MTEGVSGVVIYPGRSGTQLEKREMLIGCHVELVAKIVFSFIWLGLRFDDFAFVRD